MRGSRKTAGFFVLNACVAGATVWHFLGTGDMHVVIIGSIAVGASLVIAAVEFATSEDW